MSKPVTVCALTISITAFFTVLSLATWGAGRSADDIGFTIALSCARFPAPMTIDPAANRYSPRRRS